MKNLTKEHQILMTKYIELRVLNHLDELRLQELEGVGGYMEESEIAAINLDMRLMSAETGRLREEIGKEGIEKTMYKELEKVGLLY